MLPLSTGNESTLSLISDRTEYFMQHQFIAFLQCAQLMGNAIVIIIDLDREFQMISFFRAGKSKWPAFLFHPGLLMRHSFQDRLLAANTPDRVQPDLMGHKFNRPAYGNGASLEQQLEWMEKVRRKEVDEVFAAGNG